MCFFFFDERRKQFGENIYYKVIISLSGLDVLLDQHTKNRNNNECAGMGRQPPPSGNSPTTTQKGRVHQMWTVLCFASLALVSANSFESHVIKSRTGDIVVMNAQPVKVIKFFPFNPRGRVPHRVCMCVCVRARMGLRIPCVCLTPVDVGAMCLRVYSG